MIERFVPSGSTFAGEIDFVINLIGVLVGFWWLAVMGIFFWLLWRFRARDGAGSEYLQGAKQKMVGRWTSWPHYAIIVCDVVVIAAAVVVWVNVKQTLPESPNMSTIRVIGQQWAWTFVHPGPDNQLDTEDDIITVDELHLEVNRLYHYQLESTDVLHSFSVPIFRLKQDAVPGRRIVGWFEPTIRGSYDIQCAEICGIGHGVMGARVSIESPAVHAAWIAAESPRTALAALTDRPTETGVEPRME